MLAVFRQTRASGTRSNITRNWRGHPLVSHEVIIKLIANTTAKTGLKIRAEPDAGSYPTDITDIFQLVVYYTPFMIRMSMMRLLQRGGKPAGANSEEGAVAFASPRFFWRVLGAVIIGGLLAKWSWVLFAPHAEAVFKMPQQENGMEMGRLFGVAAVASAVNTTQVVALPNVRLLGVFAGTPGFAVLELDGKRQEGVVPGEDVVPGTKLLRVAADYVILEHAGAQQRVDMEGQPSALASAKAAVVSGARARPGG